jgi:hypothetical protein
MDFYGRPCHARTWRVLSRAELDLLLRKDGRSWGVECKRADAPKLTPSIRIARTDLELERVAVVYPGGRRYALSDDVEAVPLDALANGEPLFSDSADSSVEEI